eukprot:CAMPEP_0169149980 /NCGR_PEP_ID=MMETSP1015-20121227/49879_1 /TAXON_ID=342587 /ORGANISM="Karlodinium micrum, Strain CCMP2283" /LENGTH=263 /DNA_ID=CAMNT_0009218963 /DNA_START=34 /DNA_END=825 /DNA_ORIENTATION=-
MASTQAAGAQETHRIRRVCGHVCPSPVAASADPDLSVDPHPHGIPGKMVLYGAPTSRVQKVMWIAAECGLPFEQVKSPPGTLSLHEWYLGLNPKKTVPTARFGDLVINESNSITAFIAQRYGNSELYPSPPEKLALAWQWAEWGETTLAVAMTKIYFAIVRKVYHPSWQAKKGTPSLEEVLPFVPACVYAWSTLDKHLKDKKFMLGDTFSFADVTSGIQANRLITHSGMGIPELAPANFPAVSAWYARLCARKAYADNVVPFK